MTTLQKIRDRYNVPALAVGHLQERKLTTKLVGVRKSGDSTPIEKNDKFHLGGIATTLTATLAASLIRKGILSWNTTMQEVFSDINIHPQNQHTTISMLTAHTAGLMPGSSSAEYGIWWSTFRNASVTAVEARRRFAEYMLQQAPQGTPGVTATWSNPGYIIIAAVMEIRTTRSWEELMQELFQELGMTGCGFGVQPESSRSSVENPWPHTTSSEGPVPELPDALHGDNPAAVWPALGVHCTMESFGNFLQYHLDGYYGRPTSLLARDDFEMLQSTWPGLISSYTHGGWRYDAMSVNGTEFYISGSNTMNYAQAWLLVEHDEAFMSMTNIGEEVGRNASLAALYWVGGYTVPPVDLW